MLAVMVLVVAVGLVLMCRPWYHRVHYLQKAWAREQAARYSRFYR